MNRNQICLITGVSGFVGGYLAKVLCVSGYIVHGTYFGDVTNVMPNLDIILHECNILDKSNLDTLFSKIQPTLIFHLAALSSPALSWKFPGKTFDINVKGTLNVLEAARVFTPTAHILLVGSSDQYGDTPLPLNGVVTETLPMRPVTPYAISKVAQESFGRIYAKAYGLNIIMTRSFNHAGPRQAEAFVVSNYAHQIAEIEQGLKDPVIMVGNLDAQRDFTDVRDVVRAYVMLIENGISGEAYNVGSGRAYAIHMLLEKLLSFSLVQIKVQQDPARIRPSDTPLLVCDNTKLVVATGWCPITDIDQTLLDTLNYWRVYIAQT